MGKATGWGDFQKNWHLEHPKKYAPFMIPQTLLNKNHSHHINHEYVLLLVDFWVGCWVLLLPL